MGRIAFIGFLCLCFLAACQKPQPAFITKSQRVGKSIRYPKPKYNPHYLEPLQYHMAKPRVADKKHPYTSLVCDSVVFFDYDFQDSTSDFIPLINDAGYLARTIKKRQRLTPEQARQFCTKIESAESYGEGSWMCFYPHLGVLFFESGKVVSHITICLECNKLDAALLIPEQDARAVYGPSDRMPMDGMSRSFADYLRILARGYGFSNLAEGKLPPP